MNTAGKVKRDSTRLCKAGIHPLPDPKDSALGCELVENQVALVLLITKQHFEEGFFIVKISLEMAAKCIFPFYNKKPAPHPNPESRAQLHREQPSCRARFRPNSQSSMRHKTPGNKVSSVGHRAGRTLK